MSFDTAVTPLPFELPDDFGEVFSVVFQNVRGPRTLESAGIHGINEIPTTGQPPSIYQIQQGQLDVRPRAPGEYVMTYFQIPELDADNISNAVLDAYPNLYLHAALIELHIWAQDIEMARGEMEIFNGELGDANRAHDRRRYDAPAMRGL